MSSIISSPGWKVLFVIATFWLSSINTMAQKLKEFPIDSLQEDYQVLIYTLKEAYPSLYRYRSTRYIDSLVHGAKSQITKPMNELAFFKIVTSTISKLGDEHLIPSPSASYYEHVYKKITDFCLLA